MFVNWFHQNRNFALLRLQCNLSRGGVYLLLSSRRESSDTWNSEEISFSLLCVRAFILIFIFFLNFERRKFSDVTSAVYKTFLARSSHSWRLMTPSPSSSAARNRVLIS